MIRSGPCLMAACALLASAAQAAPSGSASSTGTTDPRIGTWRLNVADSIAPQGKTHTPYTVVLRSAAPGTIDFSYRNELADGTVEEFGYQAKIDGVLRDLPGNMGLKGSMTPMAGGVVLARLIWADGTTEEKICNTDAAFTRQICLASMTSPQKDVVFFKEVLDKVN